MTLPEDSPETLAPLRRLAARPGGEISGAGVAALARAAGESLAAGDPATAFALADRRCRLIVPSARDLMLRAQAQKASGRLESAQRDLAAAMALDPTDVVLDRAALAWGDDASRLEAAQRIVAGAKAEGPLRRRALSLLFANGERAVWRLRQTAAGVAGWIAWAGGEPLGLGLDGEVFVVEPDPDHPLAGPGIAAADIAIESDAAAPLVLSLHLREGAALLAQVEPVVRPRVVGPSPARIRDDGDQTPFVTVIVPAYEDYEATQACLRALQQARPAFAHRLVVIDDASPNEALARWLDAEAEAGAFELLRNPVNLGFAASVNRALAARERGDALLLNADALLAPGAIDRLAALSRAAPDIGLVTPFSNNGELTSWPLRHEANPMPSADEVAALDARAREANGDALIDIPNGVGFCLYVTQACLDAVGRLPELYAQGYFEDVEFALAARERGFRNVAAAGVFVGHAGSRSFGPRKRALVARNLQIIESRFPGYRLETAAFVALDPLRPYRAALDAAAPPQGPVALVIAGPGAGEAAARRARNFPGDVKAITITATAQGEAVALAAAGGGAPQSLAFDFAAGETQAFIAYLARLDVRRLEWLDPAGLPDAAVTALLALAAPTDLVAGDLNWFLPISAPSGSCATPGDAPCEACRNTLAAPADPVRRARLSRVLERAERILPLDRMAESFATRVFRSRVAPLDLSPPAPSLPQSGGLRRVAVLYPRRRVAAERLLISLARRLAASDLAADMVVFGAALDDAGLLATGAAFVAGPVAPEDYAALARDYGADAFFAPERGAGFGDLEAAAAALGAPKAYFDASFGALAAAPGDLSLDPRICDGKAATALLRWIAGELRT